MHKTRSWQESFDKLETARREVQPESDSEAQQIRDAEAAYARAAASELAKPPAPALMLVSTAPEGGESLVRPKPPAKPRKAKAAPRKRSAARRPAAKAKPSRAKPSGAKARQAKPRKSSKPAFAALPQELAEQLLITPLPRSAALTPYCKLGLFGLIGSWLRIAGRQTTAGFAGGVRRKQLRERPRTQFDELVELRAENERLRRQLADALAHQKTRTTAS